MLYAIILHYKRNWQGDWQCQPLIFLFRKSSLQLAFCFCIHGLQRVWLFLSFSIQRTRCPWLNVCCSLCRWCLVSDIPRCGGWRTRWRRCVGRGDGNGRSWRGNPMRRGCWRKKKRSCGSDKSAHDLGRDKSKNASILRKYGSICMGKSQDYFIT